MEEICALPRPAQWAEVFVGRRRAARRLILAGFRRICVWHEISALRLDASPRFFFVIPGCAKGADRNLEVVSRDSGFTAHRAAPRNDDQFTPRKSRFPTSMPLWRRMPCAIAAWK